MIPAARIHIRPYEDRDRAAVVRILGESEPWRTLGYRTADWERLFSALADGREGYVLEADGAVAGLALLRRRFLFGDYLELLAVASETRGKGLGGALLAHLEQIVFARAPNLFLCVSDFNQGARRFYRRHGYEEIGPIPNLLVPGTAEMLMRKTVGPARKASQESVVNSHG
ncbi:N-acetyltransferase family protein [Nitrospira sp. Kam-Ns4a]